VSNSGAGGADERMEQKHEKKRMLPPISLSNPTTPVSFIHISRRQGKEGSVFEDLTTSSGGYQSKLRVHADRNVSQFLSFFFPYSFLLFEPIPLSPTPPVVTQPHLRAFFFLRELSPPSSSISSSLFLFFLSPILPAILPNLLVFINCSSKSESSSMLSASL